MNKYLYEYLMKEAQEAPKGEPKGQSQEPPTSAKTHSSQGYTGHVTTAEGETVEILQAKEFVRRLEEGEKAVDAARAVGSTPAQMKRNPEVIKRIEALAQYDFTPEQERWLVKRMAMEGMFNAPTDRDKQGWAKIAISDPALGFSNENPNVIINISEEIRNLPATDLEWDKEKGK